MHSDLRFSPSSSLAFFHVLVWLLSSSLFPLFISHLVITGYSTLLIHLHNPEYRRMSSSCSINWSCHYSLSLMSPPYCKCIFVQQRRDIVIIIDKVYEHCGYIGLLFNLLHNRVTFLFLIRSVSLSVWSKFKQFCRYVNTKVTFRGYHNWI